MKLFDMKRPPIKEKLSGKVGSLAPDPYSYEHKISLDDAALTKLGVDMPKVGDKFHIMAEGHVVSTSADSSADGRNERRVGVQLKKLGMRKKSDGSALDAVNKGIDQANKAD